MALLYKPKHMCWDPLFLSLIPVLGHHFIYPTVSDSLILKITVNDGVIGLYHKGTMWSFHCFYLTTSFSSYWTTWSVRAHKQSQLQHSATFVSPKNYYIPLLLHKSSTMQPPPFFPLFPKTPLCVRTLLAIWFLNYQVWMVLRAAWGGQACWLVAVGG